jgi:diguanylate cyclase (GGDEF)-like protein/PAS domain S-box-containing protein
MFDILFRGLARRLVIVISLFMAILLLVIAAGTYFYFQRTTQQMIFDQQFSMISSMAHNLDQQIIIAHNALNNVAKVAPPDIVNDREATQKWLENRTGIGTMFNNSMIVLDRAGTLIAIVPARSGLYGTSFAYREYFRKSMKSGKPYISAPYATAVTASPVVTMTAPVRAKDGSIKGILCGSIDLRRKEGIFAATMDARLGSAGYLYMVAPDRTLILHPDSSRIMKRDVPPGANRLFDMAMEGFEGSDETVNSRGEHFLTSFKRLKTTGWILAANYPKAEAYKAITSFRNYYLSGMFFIFLVSILLVWRLGFGIVRPLSFFTSRIKDLTQPGSDKSRRLEVDRMDELGQLAASFNALLDMVQQDEQKLREKETRFRQMFEGHGVVMLMIDPHSGKIVDANPAAAKFYGYPVDRLRNMNIADINQTTPEELAAKRAQAAVGAQSQFVFPHRLSDGSVRIVEVQSTPIGASDDMLLYSIVQDITERKRAEEALAHEATHDQLTGALNRRAILDALSRECSRGQRQQTGLAVVICDVDHFKDINDTYGHIVGDEALCGLVSLLESCLRQYDYLGRWGGEEFVLVLPDVKHSREHGLYDRLRKVVEDNPVATSAGRLSITISLGVKLRKENETVDQLLTAADGALFRAKNEGRNRVYFAE